MAVSLHFDLLVGVGSLILLRKKEHKKSLLLAGVFTVLGLGILIWLGFWQLERLEWKTSLLARLDANMSFPAVSLTELDDLENSEFRKVCVEGEFLHERELHFFSTNLSGEGGYHIYTPFLISGGQAVIINRGWVPNALLDPATRPEGQIAGMQEICGVLRKDGEKKRFAPENDAKANTWFYRDRAAMGRAAGLDRPVVAYIAADETANPGGYPVGGQTRVSMPNNHLGYAITWFCLAVALAGVFTAFYISRRKGK